MIKLIILDVDGVMTDGTKTYDKNHNVISKRYCDRDFTAIKLFKELGFNVCIISSDAFNEGMAKARDIDFCLSRMSDGSINKEKFLPMLKDSYNCEYSEMIYVGDDYVDVPMFKELLRLGGYTAAPRNGSWDGFQLNPLSSYVKIDLAATSGNGVVSKLFNYIYINHMTEEQREKYNEIIAIR